MTSAPRLRIQPGHSHEAHLEQDMAFASDTHAKDMALKAAKEKRGWLLSFDDMPEWFRIDSNPWVIHGYRPISGSVSASFRSWSYIHNETVNIFSHLVPAVFFLFGVWQIPQYLTSRYARVRAADWVVFSLFMFSAGLCMTLSATYHTLLNHSKRFDSIFLRLDMLGVVLFIMGDLLLAIYTIFWCETVPRRCYWSFTGLLGSLTIFTTLNPKYQGAKYRVFRAALFGATCLSAFAPIIHGLRIFGLSLMMRKALPYTLVKMVSLITGTLCYAARFPEKQCPVTFDLWNSHSIFHILVVTAAVIQTVGYLDAFEYAYANLTC